MLGDVTTPSKRWLASAATATELSRGPQSWGLRKRRKIKGYIEYLLSSLALALEFCIRRLSDANTSVLGESNYMCPILGGIEPNLATSVLPTTDIAFNA
jgi:hypothetical protein